jgi:hypothetical protein
MTDLIATFAARGDLAHLALFLWASSATALEWPEKKNLWQLTYELPAGMLGRLQP